MKNTAYALAGEHLTGSIEDFAIVLGRHFLASGAEVERARVAIDEHAWRPIGAAPDAFTRDGSETRTARWSRWAATGIAVRRRHRRPVGDEDDPVGVQRLPARPVHELKETEDRIMATKVTASWAYERRR